MQYDYDLIIVGGGLAGNSLALALKDTALKIAIIEAKTIEQLKQSPAGDRALALAAGTVNALKQLNSWQGISHCATAIKQIHVSDKGHFAKARLSAQANHVEALGYVIAAKDIEGHLLDLIQASNIEVLSPAQVLNLTNTENSITVNLKQADSEKQLTAKLVVGADGGLSTVRELLSIKQISHDYGQTALVTTVKTALPNNNVAFERFTSSGPLALLPICKNHSAVVWTRRTKEAEVLLNSSETEFTAQLQQCFGYKLGRLTLTAPRRAFPLVLIRAEKMLSGRAVIIGNAAHQLHPVAGQGFNLGLRDVLCLADYIKQNITDCGDAELLNRYAKTRQKDQDLTIQFTDNVVRLFSNEWLALAAVRSLGLLALDHLPMAKNFLARHAMGLAQNI